MRSSLYFLLFLLFLSLGSLKGQEAQRNFKLDVGVGYNAGFISTDFLAFTRFSLPDLSRFHESPNVLFHTIYMEPRARFGKHSIGIGLGYIFASASYPNSTFTTLTGTGAEAPALNRYLSSNYGAISLSLSYERQIAFRKAFIVPRAAVGLGFVSTMRREYEGLSGRSFAFNTTNAPSFLTRNPLHFQVACYYQTNIRKEEGNISTNVQVGPYIGAISNAEFDQLFFLNGGLSLMFLFSS